ncbi:MAG TPA: YncE family protein [Hyphomicrobiaceae bacterium]|nr:YncE family protein [Hyphomicrobiaceae bacterium]
MSDHDLCLLVSGRWDNTVSVVDVRAALTPENEATPNAILNTVRVTPDLAAGAGGAGPLVASGQPVTMVVAPAAGRVFLVNHSGSARPEAAAAFQHGHPGAIAVLDLALLFDRRTAGTLAAVRAFIETGTAGPVGCALAPDARHLLVTSAEAAGREDGGRQITVIDVDSSSVLHQVSLAARGRAEREPSPQPAPHPTFGHYPCPNGIAVSPLAGGLAFTANGGTGDVSVIRLAAALRNEPGAEVVAPVPVETGPFGIAVSPDGGLVAVASRENARTGTHGRTVSLIEVERAAAGSAGAEVARVPVGIGPDGRPSRPFDVTFTPDGRHVLATCNRTGVVSCVDVAQALAGKPSETFRLELTVPSGGEPSPRGIAVAPGGRLAAVVGGRKGGPRSSLVWVIDLAERRVAATVAGVGNEAYALAFAIRPDALPASPPR